MYRNFFSVGALTALSRLTGFLREIAIGALMGQSALADAYFVALRLPNQFRAIFGEGAFNSAYVPSYSRVLATEGEARASLFASRVFALLALSQVVLLVLVYLDTPLFVEIIAPGFDRDPAKFDLAVGMTRITFPYLAFIVLTTLQSGTLNAHGYFAVAAFAPVLLNLFIIAFLGLAFLFPNAGVAASWGVALSGLAQFLLLRGESWRRGILAGVGLQRIYADFARFLRSLGPAVIGSVGRPIAMFAESILAPGPAGSINRAQPIVWPRVDADVAQFFRALGPAVIGSAGQQIAILADTILASGMPTGSVASINYADRLYQLPLGVIGVAAGTVLLPEMTRRISAGDLLGAARAQNRSIALSLAMCAPFLVGFLMIPEELIRGAYMRGAFDGEAALRSARVLEAYGFGLIPMVLIRSAVAPFQSRGDTNTPAKCFYAGLAANVVLKFGLSGMLGPVGLAAGTAVGAWINFGLLIGLARRWGYSVPDDRLYENIALMLFAAAGAALITAPALSLFAGIAAYLPWLRNEFLLAATFSSLSLVYLTLYAGGAKLFGRGLRRQLS